MGIDMMSCCVFTFIALAMQKGVPAPRHGVMKLHAGSGSAGRSLFGEVHSTLKKKTGVLVFCGVAESQRPWQNPKAHGLRLGEHLDRGASVLLHALA